MTKKSKKDLAIANFKGNFSKLHDRFKIVSDTYDSFSFTSDMDNHTSSYIATFSHDLYDVLEAVFEEIAFNAYFLTNIVHGDVHFINFSMGEFFYQISYTLDVDGFLIDIDLNKNGNSYFENITPRDVDSEILNLISSSVNVCNVYFQNLQEYRIRFLSGVYQFNFYLQEWENFLQNQKDA